MPTLFLVLLSYIPKFYCKTKHIFANGLIFDKMMKQYTNCMRKFFLLFFGLCLAFFFTSCEPDDSDDDITAARDKFIGTWTCVEASQLTYTVAISGSTTNTSEVLLANFHHLGETEKATGAVAGYSITIPEQFLCNGDYKVKGSGLMGSTQKSIIFQYVVTSGLNVDTINATYTKQ